MRFYTVHENQNRHDVDERNAFVPEGFCWPAFLVPVIWMVYRRMWIGLAAYAGLCGVLLVLLLLRDAPDQYFGASISALFLGMPIFLVFLPDPGLALAAFLGALLFGFQGHDLLRLSLARSGYRLVDIAAGPDLIEAERAWFSRPAPARRDHDAATQAAWRGPLRGSQNVVPGLDETL